MALEVGRRFPCLAGKRNLVLCGQPALPFLLLRLRRCFEGCHLGRAPGLAKGRGPGATGEGGGVCSVGQAWGVRGGRKGLEGDWRGSGLSSLRDEGAAGV